MKSNFLSLVFTVCILNLFAQQQIDWVNAPMNPVAVAYTTNHFNLHGHPSEVNGVKFNYQGKMIEKQLVNFTKGVFNYSKFGDLESTSQYEYFTTREDGVVLSYKQNANNLNNTYKYDHSKNLIYQKVGNQEAEYRYDDSHRLIKTIVRENGIEAVTTYAYTIVDGIIQVDIEIQKPTSTQVLYRKYKDGYLIEGNDENGVTHTFTYQFDKFGNWIERTETYGDTVDKKEQTISYYFDKYYKNEDGSFKKLQVQKVDSTSYKMYLDGEVINSPKFARVLKDIGSDLYAYHVPFQNYYKIIDIHNYPISDELIDAELVVENAQVIYHKIKDTKKFYVLVNGKPESTKRWKSMSENYLIELKESNKKWYFEDFHEKDNGKAIPVSYSPIDSYFVVNHETNQYSLVDSFEYIDYDNSSIKSVLSDKGTKLTFINNQPKYILPNYDDVPSFIPQPALAYTNELYALDGDYNPNLPVEVILTDEAFYVFQGNVNVSVDFAFNYSRDRKNVWLNNNNILYEVPGLLSDDYIKNTRVTAKLITNDFEFLVDFTGKEKADLYLPTGIVESNDGNYFSPIKSKGISYIKETDRSYSIDFVNKDVDDYTLLKPLISNQFIYAVGNNQYLVVKNGLTQKNPTLNIVGNDLLIKLDGQIKYIAKNYKKEVGSITPILSYTEAEYRAEYGSSDENNTEVTTSTTYDKYVNYLVEEEKKGLLKQALINLDNQWRKNNADDDQVYKEFIGIMSRAYVTNKELCFEIMMKVEEKYVNKLVTSLDPEIREYVKQKSRELVNQYNY